MCLADLGVCAPLSWICVRFGAGLLVLLQGAVAGCGCRVLLSKGCVYAVAKKASAWWAPWGLCWRNCADWSQRLVCPDMV